VAEALPIESALDALRGYDPSSQSDHRTAAWRAVRLAAEFVSDLSKPQWVELERRAAVLGDLTGRDSALRKALHALGEQLEEVLRPFRRPDGTLPSVIAWDVRTRELVEVVEETGPFPHVKAQVRTSTGEEYSARRIPQGMLISRQLGDNISATRLDQLIRMITDEKTDALDLLAVQGELDSFVEAVAPAISNPDTVATWRRELESAQFRLTMERPIGSACLLQCHEIAFAPQPQEAPSEAIESQIVTEWGAVREAATAICSWSEAAKRTPTPSRKTTKGDHDQKPMTVERWEDLGIGIDENGEYLAVPRRPAPGDTFPRSKAVRLSLRGRRWKRLLDLLAQSEFGNTAETDELLFEFRYVDRGDFRNLEDAVERTQAMQEIAEARNKLRRAVSDLARQLRSQVRCLDPGDEAVLSVKEPSVVRSRFYVRYLQRSQAGRLLFVRRPA
jgi:hypothetical protein